jgi:hypothetical protein
MSEEEKKLYLFTMSNTDLNKIPSDKGVSHHNKCNIYINLVHKQLFGSPTKNPRTIPKKKLSGGITRVSFAQEDIILN